MGGTGAEREAAEMGKGKCRGDKGPSGLAARTLGQKVLSLPHPPRSTRDLPEGRRGAEVWAWSLAVSALGVPVS